MKNKIIQLALQFAAKNGVKYPGLDVILFHFLKDELRIVSTDGHCLAFFTVYGPHGQQPGDSITVKAAELDKISSDEISLMMYAKDLFITNADTTCTSVPGCGSLADFPDYEKMIKALPVCGKSLIDVKYLELIGIVCKELGIESAYIGTHGSIKPLVMEHKEVNIYIMPMDPNEE